MARGGRQADGWGTRRGRAVGTAYPPPAVERPPPAPATGPVKVEAYVAASLGPPRWLERLQDIEAEEYRVLGALRRTWLALADAVGRDGDVFAARWAVAASAYDLSELNGLIAQHNEYFPIERRLPFDIRTGDYRAPWGIPWRRPARDASWILDHVPPDLAAARSELRAARSGADPAGLER